MSAPPALIVHVPVLGSNAWLPAGVGLPMSAHVHGDGHGTGGAGGGGPAVTTTAPSAAVASCVLSNEVTAKPASIDEPRLSVAVEPATGLQTYPSLDAYVVTVLPLPATQSNG